MAVPSGLRMRLGDEAGIGLVEVIMAIFILAVGLLALGSVSISSLASLRDTRDREQATNAASAAIEDIRTRDFGDMVHAPGDVDLGALPPGTNPAVATTGCFALDGSGEPVVEGSSANPVPFVRVAGDDGAITVHTIITYEGVACGSLTSDLKRVTVIATWRDGGLRNRVVQETLVTDVGRGLPVPRFEIRPEQANVRFSTAFLDDPAAPPRCIEHTVRNLGAEDGYDWAVEPIDPEASSLQQVQLQPVQDAFDVEGVWRVTAWLEDEPPVDTREGESPSGTDGRFQDDTQFDRLVTHTRLESGRSGLLTVCYAPLVDTAELPDELDVRIVLRSRFDERQSREAFHRVWIGDAVESVIPGEPLYLLEIPDDVAHVRRTTASPMGPLDENPAEDSVMTLSDHSYTVANADWSTDIGTPGLPGVRIRQGTDDDFRLRWHYQFGSTTRLLREATLVLWVAPPEALQENPIGNEIPMSLVVELDELDSKEEPINNGWLASETFEYEHTTPSSAPSGGWQRVEIPIDLGAERQFNNNRRLRLQVGCAVPTAVDNADTEDTNAPTAQDCNIAYDNVTFPAALYIQVK